MKGLLSKIILVLGITAQPLFGSDSQMLGEFVNSANIKGYFYAEALLLPPGTTTYLPNPGYRFFFLVLTNIKPPVAIESEQLKALNLLDSKNRQVPYSGIDFYGPNEDGSVSVLHATVAQVLCNEPESIIEISLLFIVQEESGELTLSYKGKEIPLRGIASHTPDNSFERSACIGNLEEGARFLLWLPHSHESGTAVVQARDVTPDGYSVEVKDVDTTSSREYVGIWTSIRKNTNKAIGVLVLDSSAVVLEYEGLKSRIPATGFLMDLKQRFAAFLPEQDFKRLTIIGESGSEITYEGATWGAGEYLMLIEDGVMHPFSEKGVSPHFQGNTVEIEFVFKKQGALRPSSLIIGNYILDLTSPETSVKN